MPPNPCLQVALRLLLQASEYAAENGADPWEFAVEIASLRTVGMTINDIRLLLHKGYLTHAVETTGPRDDRRSFRLAGKSALTEMSCFILTCSGAEFVATAETPPTSAGPPVEPRADAQPDAELPFWDKDRRALRFACRIVKQFKVPAPNQELILAAFEEEHWPPRIDDPLPLHDGLDPKRRLHDTINSLNRNQKHPLLRFLGDGSGEAVR